MSRRTVAFCLSLAFAAGAASTLSADDLLAPRPPYDGIQAGLDAHAVGEARRLDAINRQIGWNQLFRAQAAAQTSSSIFYDPYLQEFDYAYRLGSGGVGNGAWGGGWGPTALDFRPIWGYGYYEAVRQPIGQQQTQTGPNRWESHPIYGNEDGPVVVDAVVQPVIEPAPTETAPTERVAPTPPAEYTPRGQEF